MTLTLNIKLIPDEEQNALLRDTARKFITLINDILDCAYAVDDMPMLTSKTVHAALPSTLRGECCRTARSIWRKFKRGKVDTLPVLKKPAVKWNNQNYKVTDRDITFPVFVDGHSKRIAVRACITDKQYAVLSTAKLGSLRITQKSGKWIAQIAYETQETVSSGTGTMGVDLGIKCPAVCVCDNGKKRFFGNGRKNKAMRRRYASRRRKLQKQNKQRAVKRIGDKENRIMRDIDHKVSRQIVNFAVENGVKTIKLETLSGIRKRIAAKVKGNSGPARKSRKNNYFKNTWSFYRLAHYIEYKAKLVGIDVMYVSPAYTSQTCPKCGKHNHADDREYLCDCGYHSHRDLVGATNILAA